MYRGETITTVMSGFPVPINNIKSAYIFFKHNNQVILEKTLEDCVVEGETLVLNFSQEDSLALSAGIIMRNMIIITIDNKRFESESSRMPVRQTVKGEVL